MVWEGVLHLHSMWRRMPFLCVKAVLLHTRILNHTDRSSPTPIAMLKHKATSSAHRAPHAAPSIPSRSCLTIPSKIGYNEQLVYFSTNKPSSSPSLSTPPPTSRPSITVP